MYCTNMFSGYSFHDWYTNMYVLFGGAIFSDYRLISSSFRLISNCILVGWRVIVILGKCRSINIMCYWIFLLLFCVGYISCWDIILWTASDTDRCIGVGSITNLRLWIYTQIFVVVRIGNNGVPLLFFGILFMGKVDGLNIQRLFERTAKSASTGDSVVVIALKLSSNRAFERVYNLRQNDNAAIFHNVRQKSSLDVKTFDVPVKTFDR